MSNWAWTCWGCFLFTYICDSNKQHTLLPVNWYGSRKLLDLSLVLRHRSDKVRFFRLYNIWNICSVRYLDGISVRCFIKYLEQNISTCINFSTVKVFNYVDYWWLTNGKIFMACFGWRNSEARISWLDMDGEFWWRLIGRGFRLQM